MPQSSPKREREPFGITYDRLRLDRLLTRLVRERGISSALEVPAAGAKAMPSIYSLALARAGVEVHLVNPEPQGVQVFERLGLGSQLRVHRVDSLAELPFEEGSFDLCWNFVTLGAERDFECILTEMRRVSRDVVLTVHCNGYNLGYPWHRLLHRVFEIPWNHGQTDYFFPERVDLAYAGAGLEIVEFGHLDMPWWPDPPGFRDLRLHFGGGDRVQDFEWVAPIEEIYASGRVPLGAQLLERIEDAPIPATLRRRFSHLFFQVGAVEKRK